jgi:hypothetical protein
VAPSATFRLDVTSPQHIDPGNNPMPVVPVQAQNDDTESDEGDDT